MSSYGCRPLHPGALRTWAKVVSPAWSETATFRASRPGGIVLAKLRRTTVRFTVPRVGNCVIKHARAKPTALRALASCNRTGNRCDRIRGPIHASFAPLFPTLPWRNVQAQNHFVVEWSGDCPHRLRPGPPSGRSDQGDRVAPPAANDGARCGRSAVHAP